jgi:ABC-type dipeptide/oligopeptide/nickel transport system permease component
LRSEYVKLARLKGLSGYVVLAVHAFKKARNSSAGKSASRVTFGLT